MNDGFISVVLFLIFVFIFIGGWLKNEISATRWSAVIIVCVLLSILISPNIKISFKEMTTTAFFVVLPILIIVSLFKIRRNEWSHVILGGILVAILFNLLLEILSLDPVLIIFDERLLIGLILGLLIGIFNYPLQIKWMFATLGIWMGVIHFVIKHYSKLLHIEIFSFYEVDLLFSLYLFVTLFHLCFFSFTKWFLQKFSYLYPTKKA